MWEEALDVVFELGELKMSVSIFVDDLEYVFSYFFGSWELHFIYIITSPGKGPHLWTQAETLLLSQGRSRSYSCLLPLYH